MPRLVDILPGSLKHLRVNNTESEGLAEFDERLLGLGTSDQFDPLSKITILRDPPYRKQEELEAGGWNVSQQAIPRTATAVMTFRRVGNDGADA